MVAQKISAEHVAKVEAFLASHPMIAKHVTLVRDEDGNAVLYGAAVLIAVVILIALGGLLANAFTTAAALPDGNAFNVSTTTATNYAQDVNILYVAVLALIGLPVLGMLLAYFGFGIGKAGNR